MLQILPDENNTLCIYVAKQCKCHIRHRNYDAIAIRMVHIQVRYFDQASENGTYMNRNATYCATDPTSSINHDVYQSYTYKILVVQKYMLHISHRIYAPRILIVQNNVLRI